MIVFETNYNGKTKEVTLYHSWDVKDEDIVHDPDVFAKGSQKDKYLQFFDGYNNTFTKITSSAIYSFITGVGVFKRRQYFDLVRIQFPYTNYSGAKCYHEHQLSRPYRKAEYNAAGLFLKKDAKVGLTPRIKMIIKEKLVDMGIQLGIDPEWIVSRLIREADNMRGRGADRIEAVKVLSRMMGMELEKATYNPAVHLNNPLFAQFNQGTIQDQRRNSVEQIESRATLMNILDEIGFADGDEEVFVPAGKHQHLTKLRTPAEHAARKQEIIDAIEHSTEDGQD